jgi:hypothetical protein
MAMDKTKLALLAMGTTTVLVAGTGVTYAANGGSFILGHSNRESATSVLSNSGSGAALSLKTKSGRTPPLAVSNSTRVPNLDADLLDGLSSSALQRRVTGSCAVGQAVRAVGSGGSVSCSSPFTRVVVVHAGATAGAGGDALIAAVNGLTAGATTPALVFVEPGVYDLGDRSLVMKSDVSVVGSGPDVTTLEAETSTTSPFNGVVAATGTLADMSIDVSTSVGPSSIVNGVEIASGVATLRNLVIAVDGLGAAAGLRLDGGRMNGRDLSVNSPDIGISDVGGRIDFWDGLVSGAGEAATLVGGAQANIVGSEVAGAVSGSTFSCAGDFDLNFHPLSQTCAPTP